MEAKMTMWYPVLGFGILSWGCFLAAGVLALPTIQSHVAWVFGVAGLAFAVIAGFYARATWIADLVSGFIGLGELTRAVTFGGLLILIIVTPLALIIDKLAPKLVLSLPIAMAWVVAMPALYYGALPGNWGQGITSAVKAISNVLVQKTAGAW
jgi:hypothetical protein